MGRCRAESDADMNVPTLLNITGSRSPLDDAMELMTEARLARRPADEIFGAEDIPFLHMKNGDIATSNETPNLRLEQLLPFSFATTGATNPLGADIRERFTTESWTANNSRSRTGRYWARIDCRDMPASMTTAI